MAACGLGHPAELFGGSSGLRPATQKPSTDCTDIKTNRKYKSKMDVVFELRGSFLK
jgi:hypothetical protein